MSSDWFDQGQGASPVDVGKVMDSDVPELLWTVVSLGALVSVGTTSDGGALSVTVTMNGRWRRVYVREADELCDWLRGACEAVGSHPARSSASTDRRPRRQKAV